MRSRLTLLIGVWCLCLATSARADYRTEFREGVRALNIRNWTDAIRRFRLAIKDQPKESGERVNISGGDFELYLPHALLGLALYQATGRCDQALAEWQISRAQNAPWDRLTQSGALQRAVAACPAPNPPADPDPAAFKAALQRADKSIADALDAQRDVAAFGKDPALQPLWSGNARLGPAQGAADAELAGARRTLDEARKTSDAGGAARAEQAANSARDKFTAVRSAANEVSLAAAQPRPKTDDKTTSVVNPTGPVVVDPRKNPTPTENAPTTRTPAPVPRNLVTAARQFFRADYASAASGLSAAKFDRPDDALQAEWFKAASYYSLYLISGKKDEAARARAEQHVRTCRRLRPTFKPDQGFFSPALIAFYQGVR